MNIQPQPFVRILLGTGSFIDTTYGEYERIKFEWNEFVMYNKDRLIEFQSAGDTCCVVASAIISVASSTLEGQVEAWVNDHAWDMKRKEVVGFEDE